MGWIKMTAFIGGFGKKKLEQTAQTINDGLASWDPETASEVEIEMMIGKLEGITGQLAEAKVDYAREKKEADAALVEFEKQMKIAERIQEALEEEPDNAEYAEALNDVLSTLEELKPELEREQQEAAEAEEIYRELEQIAEMYAEKLKTARATLEAGKRDMKKAQLREQRSLEREDRTKELAGLKNGTDELGSALKAFQRNADKANTAAEASEIRADLLKPKEKKSSAVLERFAAEVTGDEKPTNVNDRLAALRK